MGLKCYNFIRLIILRFKGVSNMQERVLPQNIEAEQAVLGAMLMDSDAIIKASELLIADDFYREAHKIIFSGWKPITLIMGGKSLCC